MNELSPFQQIFVYTVSFLHLLHGIICQQSCWSLLSLSLYERLIICVSKLSPLEPFSYTVSVWYNMSISRAVGPWTPSYSVWKIDNMCEWITSLWTNLFVHSVSFFPLQYGMICVNEYPASTTIEHSVFWSFSLLYLYWDK